MSYSTINLIGWRQVFKGRWSGEALTFRTKMAQAGRCCLPVDSATAGGRQWLKIVSCEWNAYPPLHMPWHCWDAHDVCAADGSFSCTVDRFVSLNLVQDRILAASPYGEEINL